MKLVYLTSLCIFCTTVYAQTESSSQVDTSPQMQSVQVNQNNDEKAFFSIDLGGEVTPAYNLRYNSTVIGLKVGGLISQQQTFNAGLKITTARFASSFLSFNYAYSFVKGRQWIPGVDISLLVGLNEEKKSSDYSYYPTIGLELGPYLKTFISNSFALLLRSGVTHSINTNAAGDFDFRELRLYLNLGVQWYF